MIAVEWISRRPLWLQIMAGTSTVAGVAILLAYMAVTRTMALGTQASSDSRALAHAVTLVVAFLVLVASCGTTLVIMSSIRRSLARIGTAARTIADGDFAHRIASTRRDELRAVADEIDEMAGRLGQLESARRNLLAGVSHELRTPLTVIRGYCFTLGRDEADPARRERFDVVEGEIERLASLIDDLLAAAQTARTQGVRSEANVDVSRLLWECAARFAEQAEERELEIVPTCSLGQTARCDVDRVHQVLGNLVSNALSHAPSGSRVELEAAAREQRLHIVVRDRGPGIPADEQAAIFQPFVQGSSPTGSLGLGLSIARDIVREHGGELRVTSREGCTEFSFDLALVPEPVETTSWVDTALRTAAAGAS